MNEPENILTLDRTEPGAAQAPAQGATVPTSAASSYPLDWGTKTIKLKDGKFRHKLRRPTTEEIFEREDELQSDIPLSKDGSFEMPDPTANEEIDARFYDKLICSVEGYAGSVPAAHKAAAIAGLHLREVYIPEDADPFADVVSIVEEIGQGDEPDFTIVHLMRQPAEAELKRYRRRSSNGQIKPGKRGKQRFISKSTLKNAVEHYDLWCTDIKGARLDDTANADLAALKNAVDPLIKRQVVQTLAEAIIGGLLD